MKTILFPTDFSMNSIHAIRYGLELFKNERDIHFILFNAYVDPSTGATMTYVWEDHMQNISQTMLGSLHEKLMDDYGFTDLTAQCISQYGDLPMALRPVVEKHKVDLIIMGASGAGSPSVKAFGENSYETMKAAACPVLTVPLQTPIKPPRRIGLASETKYHGDEEFLRPLIGISELHGSWVMGINVKQQSKTATVIEDEEVIFGDIPDLEYIDLNDSDPLIGIESAIGMYELDMLSIILKKRTLLDRIFHKSVSKQIARQVAIPILTMHV